MNKQAILTYLDDHQIPYELTEHEPVFSMEEVFAIDMPYPEGNAKNLFVRDKKKRHYYLITVKGEKRVDLKKIRDEYGTTKLSFASADDLEQLLNLKPGEVSPFGLLNLHDTDITYFMDEELFNGIGMTGVHPGVNTSTVWLKTTDLEQLIADNGIPVQRIAIS